MTRSLSFIALGIIVCGALSACESEKTSPEALAERAEADRPVEEGASAEGQAGASQAVMKEKAGQAENVAGDKEDIFVKVGAMAPDFTLKTQEGREISLSDLKGKPVVLEWTNPTCPYVVRHYDAKTMAKTHEASGGAEAVEWFAIDSSHFVDAEKATSWREQQAFDYDVLLDPTGEVGRQYKATNTPQMVVIDQDGKIAYMGAIDNNDRGDKKPEETTNYVTDALRSLKEGKPVSVPETKAYGCSVKYKS